METTSIMITGLNGAGKTSVVKDFLEEINLLEYDNKVFLANFDGDEFEDLNVNGVYRDNPLEFLYQMLSYIIAVDGTAPTFVLVDGMGRYYKESVDVQKMLHTAIAQGHSKGVYFYITRYPGEYEDLMSDFSMSELEVRR